MAGEVTTTLQFSEVATQTRYYRAVITSAVNTPTALDQMQISLTKNANALAVDEIYYVKIGSGTYQFTTTNAASNTDDIGAGLSQEINNNAPGVSSSYDSDVNIISIIPLQSEISISTSVSTASHDLKILSSQNGDGCKAIKYAKENVLIINTVPMKRVILIDTNLSDYINKIVIKEQVELVFAVRMACLKIFCKKD